MQANIYLKFEDIKDEERKKMYIAIEIMNEIADKFSKVYGRADAFGFEMAISSIESILNNELF